jgi:hypothetical protein
MAGVVASRNMAVDIWLLRAVRRQAWSLGDLFCTEVDIVEFRLDGESFTLRNMIDLVHLKQ